MTVSGVEVSIRRLAGGNAGFPGFESDDDDDPDGDDAPHESKRQRSTDAKPDNRDSNRTRGSASSGQSS